MIRNRIRFRRNRLGDRNQLLYHSEPLMGTHRVAVPYPPTNVKEHDQYFDMELALNGFKKEELQVILIDNILTVVGEKENRIVRDEIAYIQKEYDFDTFKREFELDDITDPARIEAFLKEDKLVIRLYHKDESKAEEGNPARMIPIQ